MTVRAALRKSSARECDGGDSSDPKHCLCVLCYRGWGTHLARPRKRALYKILVAAGTTSPVNSDAGHVTLQGPRIDFGLEGGVWARFSRGVGDFEPWSASECVVAESFAEFYVDDEIVVIFEAT